MNFETKLTPVKIGLTEMLEALWGELYQAGAKAIERGEGRFVFEEAEIEVAVAVEAKSDAKFSLHVVEFGGGLAGTRTATVRVKVKQLTPEVAKDPSRLVMWVEPSDEQPSIGGARATSREDARKKIGGNV